MSCQTPCSLPSEPHRVRFKGKPTIIEPNRFVKPSIHAWSTSPFCPDGRLQHGLDARFSMSMMSPEFSRRRSPGAVQHCLGVIRAPTERSDAPPDGYGAAGDAGDAGRTESDECQCVHFQPSSPLRSTTVLRDGCNTVLPSNIVAWKSNSTVQ